MSHDTTSTPAPAFGRLLQDLRGCLRDPDRPYPAFLGGCPAPLRDGVEFTELCGACPMQAAGVAMDRSFSFHARYGRWEMTIEGACGPEHYCHHFSGHDRWDGWMPPSVAFALVTSKLLWHVCTVIRESGEWPPPKHMTQVLACGSDHHWQTVFRMDGRWEWSDGSRIDDWGVSSSPATYWRILPPPGQPE